MLVQFRVAILKRLNCIVLGESKRDVDIAVKKARAKALYGTECLFVFSSGS